MSRGPVKRGPQCMYSSDVSYEWLAYNTKFLVALMDRGVPWDTVKASMDAADCPPDLLERLDENMACVRAGERVPTACDRMQADEENGYLKDILTLLHRRRDDEDVH